MDHNFKIALKHAIIAMFVFGLLSALLVILLPLTEELFMNPPLNLMMIFVIILCVLFSYIVYLLLSARTRAELAAIRKANYLYASLRQLQGMYEGAPVPYLTLDKEGKALDLNKAALRFFERAVEDIVGKSLFLDLLREDSKKTDKFLRYYKSKVPLNREEIRVTTKSGREKWALLSVFRMEGPIKRGREGLATLFDITPEKELDKAKTEFISLASHQLRTPTATFKWIIDVLLSNDLGEVSPKQREYLERARTVNNNMIELVDTILNISRIEIGSIVPEINSTNVPRIIDGILIEMAGQIEKKQLNVKTVYNGNLENIESDPKLLRIIIQNVVSNAIKYTPSGGEINIELKESAFDKVIIIRDTGIGIKAEDQDKIFGKLFRGGNANDLEGSAGTGLGLYLVKLLLKPLDGEISFESQENKGSIFTIKL